MSPDFCCISQMVGSKFSVNNTKAWIRPDLYEWFRLFLVSGVIVWRIFVEDLHMLGSLVLVLVSII